MLPYWSSWPSSSWPRSSGCVSGSSEHETIADTYPLQGWWRIDKVGLLSPFGLAKTFDSPLVQQANSALGARGIVQELGGVEVKYGAVGEPGGKYHLGIAETQDVSVPYPGMRFDV